MNRKSALTLLAVCGLGLVAVYFGVNRYIERVDANESVKLQEQRDAYAKARVQRLQQSKTLLAMDELRIKLGLADQPDAEIQILEEAMQDGTLTGAVEAKIPTGSSADPEVRKHQFRIEYDDNGEVRSCELLD